MNKIHTHPKNTPQTTNRTTNHKPTPDPTDTSPVTHHKKCGDQKVLAVLPRTELSGSGSLTHRVSKYFQKQSLTGGVSLVRHKRKLESSRGPKTDFTRTPHIVIHSHEWFPKTSAAISRKTCCCQEILAIIQKTSHTCMQRVHATFQGWGCP